MVISLIYLIRVGFMGVMGYYNSARGYSYNVNEKIIFAWLNTAVLEQEINFSQVL